MSRRHGFAPPQAVSETAYDQFAQQYSTVLQRRAQRWTQHSQAIEHMIQANQADQTCRPTKLKRFIRKGIPCERRALLWLRLSGAQQQMDEHPGLFAQYIAKSEADRSAVDAIQLDLARTFPDNRHFQNASGKLHRHELDLVLRAVAARYPTVGYCQGLNYIAALCLLVTQVPEHAFWLMDANLKYLKDYYRQDMGGLKMEMQVLTQLLREKSPSIHNVFVKNDVDLQLVCSKWFLCWYLDCLPIETVLRVWDCLFFEGSKILFRVALTLILINKDLFNKCRNFIDISHVMKQICNNDKALDAHSFMQAMFTAPGVLSTRHITELRQQYIDSLQQHNTQQHAPVTQTSSSAQCTPRPTHFSQNQLDKIIVRSSKESHV